MRVLPGWLRDYRRDWLVADVLAGLIVWSVVVPQAVAYAQIAGLPPSAGLIAAPGALLAYAALGTSRTLIVSATTATSALSAAAVGPLAHGDAKRFAALSVALAIAAGIALAAAGVLRLGGVMDLVSKPVMTGFLFGLGLTVTVGQLPALFGVPAGSGNFFPRVRDLLRDLDDTNRWTLAMGLGCIVALVLLRRLAPRVPGTLVVLIGSIVVSAALDLRSHGVDVVGHLPRAVPEATVPDVGWHDFVDLLPAALGVLVVSAEAVGVGRTLAAAQGEHVDVNRDLVALGGSNVLAGFSGGFVQSGGASQTMAAQQAGGKSQLTSLVAAALILVTGAFLTGLFRDLPQATLAAIVVVAIAGFFRVDELRRFARIRRSALMLSLVALAGVLALGVLPGLLVAVGLSLVLVIQRLSRPPVGTLARDPRTGVWGHTERHPGAEPSPGVLVAGVEGPLFYTNAVAVKERVLELAAAVDPPPQVVVLDLADNHDLDVQTLDMLGDLAGELAARGMELRLASVHASTSGLLERSGLAAKVRLEPTIEAAVS